MTTRRLRNKFAGEETETDAGEDACIPLWEFQILPRTRMIGVFFIFVLGETCRHDNITPEEPMHRLGGD